MRRPESEKRWSESARQVLDRALDQPTEQRRRFVEERLPAGPERDEVLELLDQVESLDGFLETPLAASTIEPPPLPATIGGHRVTAVLGWGSMGVVYKARQSDPDRTVAIKLLRLDCVGAAAADRFRREVRLLAGLRHPSIATVHESGIEDLGAGPQPWFSMEYVDGTSLRTHADEKGLDRRERVSLIVQVARAVQHAHAAGIVHRDLKPENVLVRDDGSICVLDFGVAAVREADETLLTLTATGQVVGTLAYMAPEQARGARLDARADQYALGAMLYELLTDELPIPVRGRLPHDALRVIADGTWTAPTRHDASLAGDLEAILGTALAPEPNQRFASVRELADDLERWLAGEPVKARPPSMLAGVQRFVRRHAKLVSVAALVLVLLGALGALALHAVFERRSEGRVALLYSDRELLDSLSRRAEGLWPTSSAVVPELRSWLDEARGLAQRLDDHRSTRAELEAGRSRSAVVSSLGRTRLLEQTSELIGDLETFVGADGLLADLETRHHRAATLRARTIEARRDAWRAAAERVRADPRFGGFELAPQEGLVPLGPDPDSGLEEFAVDGTGDVPVRPSPPARLRPAIGSATVLVLIPGGPRWIGGQREEPGAPNFVAPPTLVGDHEIGPCRVELEPFLIAKFECTQDEWRRWTGINPSEWEVGSLIQERRIGPLHPVESLSWEQIQEQLPRVGLQLPTEAQWEVAARGGAPACYVHGASPHDLAAYVNANTYQRNHPSYDPEFPDDGYQSHMPAGSFGPNPFGLHDVLGNVWELCLDTYKVDYHQLPHRERDGLVLAEPDGDVTRRGGCAGSFPYRLVVYVRQVKRFDGRDALTGFRAARRLSSSRTDSGEPRLTSLVSDDSREQR